MTGKPLKSLHNVMVQTTKEYTRTCWSNVAFVKAEINAVVPDLIAKACSTNVEAVCVLSTTKYNDTHTLVVASIKFDGVIYPCTVIIEDTLRFEVK